VKKIVDQIGATGLAAIVLLAAALAFSSFVVRPLEARHELLKETVGRQARAGGAAPASDKLAAVYQFLERGEDTTDWLAKLHAIGVGAGVQLKSASYRSQKTEGRIVRYEIMLPVSGSYPQIRDFLKRALTEIPVLSLDSISVKRSDQALQAEMRLTLHLVKS
jgi:hypothetical protein